MKLVGYSDRWSVAPGETVRFMVSSQVGAYRAEIVRLFHGDPEPEGPGLKLEPVETPVDGEYPGREQPLRLGSYAIVDPHPALDPSGAFRLETWIWPTTPGSGAQGILTRWSQHQRRGFGLFLEEEGDVSLRLDGETVRTHVPLRASTWYRAEAAYDPAGRVSLRVTPRPGYPLDSTGSFLEEDARARAEASGLPLVFGGHVDSDGLPVGSFNGKLDSPLIAAGGHVVGAWDFARGMAGDRIEDTSGNGLHGRTVNLPMRAVTGRNWTGREVDPRNAPAEYGAIFFHDDDLDDAGWQPDFELVVPERLASGVYAARLQAAGGEEEWLPFFVRPPRGRATAPIAFLAPTFSYLAYANEHAAIDNPVAVTDFDLWEYMQTEDRYAMDVPLVGLYDHHRDGTGVCYSSRLHPIVNMRPHYHLPLVRSAHQFPADLHLVDWLRASGFEVDVVTDEDLHEEGPALLARYRAVLTGSHPEYWTERMLDSLEEYLDSGGRLMYLGGNGFYWVTTIDPARPHVIEVRRGRRGTGTWRSAPGEDHHSTTGELGGLWRDRGRAPQRLVGTGMATQGFDRALPFEREPGSGDPRAAWIFEGVEPGPIGETGLVMGGAGGLEVDRLDHALGTPPHALPLASVTGFSDSYQHVVEEVASSDSRQGGSVSPFVRGDMVFFETPNGGAVFSASSIAWCGCLSANGYDNAVSQITGNVLRRFASEEPILPIGEDAETPAPSTYERSMP